MLLRHTAPIVVIAVGLVAPSAPAGALVLEKRDRPAISHLDIGVVGVGRPRILVRGPGYKRVVKGSVSLKVPVGRYRIKALPVLREGVRYIPRQRPYLVRTTTRRVTFVGFQYSPATDGAQAARGATLPADPPPAGELGAMFAMINSARVFGAQCGQTTAAPAAPLEYDRRLARSAQAHAEDMARSGTLTHTSSDGLGFAERVHASGFRGFPGGENIAFDLPTARETVDAWLSSPGHCMNLMDPEFGLVGLGLAERTDPRYPQPIRYWVQDMGYPPTTAEGLDSGYDVHRQDSRGRTGTGPRNR